MIDHRARPCLFHALDRGGRGHGLGAARLLVIDRRRRVVGLLVDQRVDGVALARTAFCVRRFAGAQRQRSRCFAAAS
ncbi:unnamed protein product [Pelagomonas calceolata]|uniref:Uncharacterized protein n=1 Tax=Pelagomonas calceolata TaxID=35677 RepID=A0A8J2SNP2_9STRA|nr:unnamed protein product [Pelagomonas calceolata]